MSEAKLDKEQQLFIVQQLAMFERPKSVKLKLKEIYDVEISIQGISHYQISSKELSKELRKVFNATRKKFLKDSSAIPIANKSVRLQKLQNMFDKQEDAPFQNTVVMRDILEQAAKESGDAFSNKRSIEVKNVSKLSDEELQSIVEE